MTLRARVQELIAYVEQGLFLEAYREFYHNDVAVQENDTAPRLGLASSLEHETCFLETVETFDKINARSFIVDGNRAAIRWNFEATLKGGRRMSRDEIAYQEWDGEKIICERYFFDSNPQLL